MLYWAVMSAAFVFGALPSLVSEIFSSLAKTLGKEPSQGRWMTLAFFAGCIVTMPTVGRLVDEKGLTTTFLILGSLLLCGILIFLALTKNYSAGLAMAGLLSFAFACFALGTLYLMPTSLAGRVSEALNLGFIPVALGALTAHLVYPLFEQRFGLRKTLIGLGIVCLIPGFLTLFHRDPLNPMPPAPMGSSPFEAWRFTLFMVILFLYFTVENVLEVWTEPYLRDARYSTNQQWFQLSLFWLSFLAGRFLIYYFHAGRESVYCLCAFLIAITLGNLAGAFGNNAIRLLGLHFAGMCLGPLFPGFLGLLCEAHPREQGVVLGWALAIYGINHSLVEPWLARYAEKHPPHRVFKFASIFALIMGILLGVDMLREK